jgi:hypothetical protein
VRKLWIICEWKTVNNSVGHCHQFDDRVVCFLKFNCHYAHLCAEILEVEHVHDSSERFKY